MRTISTTVLVLAGILGSAASLMAGDVDLSKLPPDSTRTNLTFDADIKPMFRVSCFACHSGAKAAGGLNLTTLSGVLKGSKDGLVLTAGDSAHSPLVIAISRLDPDTAMPPKMHRRPTAPPSAGTGAPPPGGGTIVPPPGSPLEPPMDSSGAPHGSNLKPLSAEQVGLVRAWIDQGSN